MQAQFMHGSSVCVRAHALVSAYLCFRLANMLLLKEKLTIQIADINGVQVNLGGRGRIKCFLEESLHFWSWHF